jgi:hypothetical protein
LWLHLGIIIIGNCFLLRSCPSVPSPFLEGEEKRQGERGGEGDEKRREREGEGGRGKNMCDYSGTFMTFPNIKWTSLIS